MKLWQILPSKRYKTVIICIFAIVSVYFFLQIFLFKSDPVFVLKSYLAKSYLFAIEKFANLLLNLSGSHATFNNFSIVSNNTLVNGFTPEVRFEQLTFLLIILIWLTKAPFKEKLLFTLFLFMAHFISNSIYISAGAQMVAIQGQNRLILSIPVIFWLMAIFTLFFMWFRRHKRIILSGLSKYKININLLENNFHVILFIYAFIVIISLLTEMFEYKIWIGFLFRSSQKILAVLGYEAVIDNLRLVGTYGTIGMSKACLGFQMMLLFVVMIILTGNNNRFRWIFIIIGLVFLNIINILRFVFLFIHLQNHGNYILSIEAHNFYNYLTYAIVFIIWIIWFEKFADIKASANISSK